MINYHNKVFITVQNSENGDTDNQTFFLYQQKGDIVSAKYGGGPIIRGELDGIINERGELDMQYHHVNTNNELLTGICHSVPEIMPNGKIRITESWQWTSKNFGQGQSVLEEVNDSEKYKYIQLATSL